MGRKRMTLKRRRAEEAEKRAAKHAPYTEGYEPLDGAWRAADKVTYLSGVVLTVVVLFFVVVGLAVLIH